jgi:hypothetical protein
MDPSLWLHLVFWNLYIFEVFHSSWVILSRKWKCTEIAPSVQIRKTWSRNHPVHEIACTWGGPKKDPNCGRFYTFTDLLYWDKQGVGGSVACANRIKQTQSNFVPSHYECHPQHDLMTFGVWEAQDVGDWCTDSGLHVSRFHKNTHATN